MAILNSQNRPRQSRSANTRALQVAFGMTPPSTGPRGGTSNE